MSWTGTYSHGLALGADLLGSAICWSNRRLGLTMSSVAGMELRAQAAGQQRLSARLLWLGRMLNRIQAGHCEMAIAADLARLKTDIAFLTAIPCPSPQKTS